MDTPPEVVKQLSDEDVFFRWVFPTVEKTLLRYGIIKMPPKLLTTKEIKLLKD